jgi:hypothetical protein
MNHFSKILTGLLIFSVFTMGVFAQQSNQFNFSTTVSFQGKNLDFDMVSLTPFEQSGAYIARIRVGVISDNTNSAIESAEDFIDNLDNNTATNGLRIKKKGASVYDTRNISIDVGSGGILDSNPNKYLSLATIEIQNIPAGEYTVDALVDGKNIKSIDICLGTCSTGSTSSSSSTTTTTGTGAGTGAGGAGTGTSSSATTTTTTTTTATQPVVQAATCGSAHNGTFPTRPATNLCGSGSYLFGAIVTTSTGDWTWRCSLLTPNSTNASCSAKKQTTATTQTNQQQNTQAGQTGTETQTGAGTQTGTQTGGQAGSQQTLTGSGLLKNPLPYDSIPEIIQAVVNNIVLPIAVPFIGLMIMYSGFLFVIARQKGSAVTYEKAKTTLKYTLIGAALILGAFVIANTLQATLNALVN